MGARSPFTILCKTTYLSQVCEVSMCPHTLHGGGSSHVQGAVSGLLRDGSMLPAESQRGDIAGGMVSEVSEVSKVSKVDRQRGDFTSSRWS